MLTAMLRTLFSLRFDISLEVTVIPAITAMHFTGAEYRLQLPSHGHRFHYHSLAWAAGLLPLLPPLITQLTRLFCHISFRVT